MLYVVVEILTRASNYAYTPINDNTAGAAIAAIIWMGDPRNTLGAPYNVGTSTAPG
jgi:hypothetical protein